MKMMRSLFLVAGASVAVAGCAVAHQEPGPEESIGAAELAISITPPPGPNGKRPRCFWHPKTQEAYQKLGEKALSDAPSLPDIPADCREEVLRNVIECALSPRQTWTDPDNPRTTYSGWWGLATQWVNNPLDADGRRWVTACMAQRLNYYGETVEILLEGAATPINTHSYFDPLFPFDESNAWGDLFSTPPTDHFEIYVCWSPDLEQVCNTATGGTPSKWLNLRVCDGEPGWELPDGSTYPCGLHIMGPCASPSVCASGESYPSCYRPDGTLDDHTVHVQMEWPLTCQP